MIIVSQNKKTIISTDNFNYIEVEEQEQNYRNFIYNITAYYYNTYKRLGKYSTEERAMEVFQEIIRAYKGKKMIQFQENLSNEDLEKLNRRYEKDVIYYDLKTEVKQMTNDIYEMPKE